LSATPVLVCFGWRWFVLAFAVCFFFWHPRIVGVFHAVPFGVLGFALASANCYLASRVAPVRGGTYFSLPPQRKVGKRKRLTPPVLILA
jgi:hypothetical protein